MQGLLTGLVLAALGAGVAGAQTEEVVTLATRPGQSIRVLVQRPAGPALGSVVLIAGGHGNLEISADGRLGWGAPNQLVRSSSGQAGPTKGIARRRATPVTSARSSPICVHRPRRSG